jgi:hypothetical protein
VDRLVDGAAREEAVGAHPLHRSGTPNNGCCALTELRLAMPAELDIILLTPCLRLGDYSRRFRVAQRLMNDAHDRSGWPLSSPALIARMFDNV